MPLWSDLFEGHDKSKPFKPKRSESVGSDQVSESSQAETSRGPPSPSTPRKSRELSPLKTPPTVRRNANSSGSQGVKKSPSFRTPSPSKTAPSPNDTIAEIHQTLERNREKKSSTPKTPQTPKPPAIQIDPVISGLDSDSIPRLDDFKTPEKGAKVHLDPLNSDSQGNESFSVDWNLDNIMNKSVQEFAQSINMIEACPSNTSHLLSNADTEDLLAPSVGSDCQELPDDCPGPVSDSDPPVRPGISRDLHEAPTDNSMQSRSLNDSNPNPWILVQVNMCVIRHLLSDLPSFFSLER